MKLINLIILATFLIGCTFAKKSKDNTNVQFIESKSIKSNQTYEARSNYEQIDSVTLFKFIYEVITNEEYGTHKRWNINSIPETLKHSFLRDSSYFIANCEFKNVYLAEHPKIFNYAYLFNVESLFNFKNVRVIVTCTLIETTIVNAIIISEDTVLNKFSTLRFYSSHLSNMGLIELKSRIVDYYVCQSFCINSFPTNEYVSTLPSIKREIGCFFYRYQ